MMLYGIIIVIIIIMQYGIGNGGFFGKGVYCLSEGMALFSRTRLILISTARSE